MAALVLIHTDWRNSDNCVAIQKSIILESV